MYGVCPCSTELSSAKSIFMAASRSSGKGFVTHKSSIGTSGFVSMTNLIKLKELGYINVKRIKKKNVPTCSAIEMRTQPINPLDLMETKGTPYYIILYY